MKKEPQHTFLHLDVKNAANAVEIAVTMSLWRPQNPNVVIATYLETAKVGGIVADFPAHFTICRNPM